MTATLASRPTADRTAAPSATFTARLSNPALGLAVLRAAVASAFPWVGRAGCCWWHNGPASARTRARGGLTTS